MTDDERTTIQAAAGPEPERGDAARRGDGQLRESQPSGLTIVLWAIASIGLLAYVALGSTPAYVWRFGRKYQEFKSVLGTWTIEANNLPRVSHQWLMEGAFYAALILFLLGSITGIWFLLGARDGETLPVDTPPTDSEMISA